LRPSINFPTIFTGADGSSLIAVESGQVDVSAGGETVELFPEEGVEVAPGGPPGEKFKVLRGKIDYADWNSERVGAFLDDPAGAARKIGRQLQEYIDEINALLPEYERLRELIFERRERYSRIREEQGREKAAEYHKENIEPYEAEATPMFVNIRYYALSALSLRRHILGRLYMLLKTEYINDLDNPRYTGFLKQYEEVLENYRNNVSPLLVEADI
jgi:hypothetical protein